MAAAFSVRRTGSKSCTAPTRTVPVNLVLPANMPPKSLNRKPATCSRASFPTAAKSPSTRSVRAGGVESLAAYLDKAQARHDTKVMGNFHHYHHCNPDQPQTRVPFLAGNKGGVESEENYPDYGYDSEYGIGDVSTSVRSLWS